MTCHAVTPSTSTTVPFNILETFLKFCNRNVVCFQVCRSWFFKYCLGEHRDRVGLNKTDWGTSMHRALICTNLLKREKRDRICARGKLYRPLFLISFCLFSAIILDKNFELLCGIAVIWLFKNAFVLTFCYEQISTFLVLYSPSIRKNQPAFSSE